MSSADDKLKTGCSLGIGLIIMIILACIAIPLLILCVGCMTHLLDVPPHEKGENGGILVKDPMISEPIGKKDDTP